MQTTDMAYAAGVLDSDGYMGITRNRSIGMVSRLYRPRIVLKQVTPEAVELIDSLWPGHRRMTKSQSENGRPLYTWLRHSRAAGETLEDLLPYLRIKRAQAENIIEVCRILQESPAPSHEPIPEPEDDEPLVSLADAARELGISYQRAYSAIRSDAIPVVHKSRKGRPKGAPTTYTYLSCLHKWSERGRPRRPQWVTEELERCYQRAKNLNRVGRPRRTHES